MKLVLTALACLWCIAWCPQIFWHLHEVSVRHNGALKRLTKRLTESIDKMFHQSLQREDFNARIAKIMTITPVRGTSPPHNPHPSWLRPRVSTTAPFCFWQLAHLYLYNQRVRVDRGRGLSPLASLTATLAFLISGSWSSSLACYGNILIGLNASEQDFNAKMSKFFWGWGIAPPLTSP